MEIKDATIAMIVARLVDVDRYISLSSENEEFKLRVLEEMRKVHHDVFNFIQVYKLTKGE